MKKLIVSAAMSLLLLCAGTPAIIASAATAEGVECDEVFAATVGSIADSDENSVKATRKPLYDIEVNPLGYVYEYTLDGAEGYAVFIQREGNFVPQEVIPEGTSPYAEVEGKCIYVCSFTYLEYNSGEYTELSSGITLLPETVEDMADNAVYGDSGISLYSSSTVYIEFKSKDKQEYIMTLQPPSYTATPFVSGCACLAGANIIGFYDRYYVNLIPNYEPGYLFLNVMYMYYGQSSEIFDVLEQLYVDMGTTVNGTTEPQFISGMKKYCNRAGYNFGYTSLMSGSKLNYSAVANYIENYNQPVALFLSGFNVAIIGERDNIDGFGYYYENTNHVMAGFGYKYITYTYNNGSQETFNFIYVSSGKDNAPVGYFNTSYNTTIDDVLAINIY